MHNSSQQFMLTIFKSEMTQIGIVSPNSILKANTIQKIFVVIFCAEGSAACSWNDMQPNHIGMTIWI